MQHELAPAREVRLDAVEDAIRVDVFRDVAADDAVERRGVLEQGN